MGKPRKDAENIRVVVRVRPLDSKEAQTCKDVVHLDLAMGSVSVHHAVGDPDKWTFDAVYNDQFTQTQIFKAEVMPLVQSVLDGYNATVFAYGQSGSGKTYTMTGNIEKPDGMMPHALNALFDGIKLLEGPQKFYRVKVSYVELYNGKARDLFSKKQCTLEVKQNTAGNFFVQGLEQPEVSCMEDCMKLFHEGTKRRQVSATGLNDQSSRSHAIFCCTIVSTDHEADADSPVVMQSKLNLCDLAGSERQSKTNTTGDTLKEGCSINLSLSALGTVIDTLVKGKGHVPYRSSPLTMLLKDSLGGTSKTVMFANVGPADKNVSETISTLRFADRAKKIENKPVKNLDPKDRMINDLKAQVEELKKRLERAGGGGSLEEEEGLQKQIETLQLERDQDQQAWERDKLELERELDEKTSRVKELMELAERGEQELQKMSDSKKMEGSQLQGLRDELIDLKKMIVEFFQRIVPMEVLEKATENLASEGDDDVWDRNKIWAAMEAAQEHIRDNRGVTEEEMNRRVESERNQLENQLRQLQDTLDRERQYFQEEAEKERQIRSEEGEAHARTKCELQAKEQEVTRLKEKITRDLDKFKQKLQTKQSDRDEIQATLMKKEEELQEKVRELERMQQAVGEREVTFEKELQKRLGEQRKEHEKAIEDLNREIEGRLEKAETEKAALQNKVNQLDIRLKQRALVHSKGGKDEGDAVNDGFIDDTELENLGDSIDKDMYEELHTQVRLQCRLQRLRHTQQKQLDAIVERYQRAVKDGRGKITNEKMLEEVARVVSEKDAEIQAVRAEAQKQQDKLVKGINKKLAEAQETQKTLQEEIQSLEDENKELTEMNNKLSKQNETAMETVEHLKGLLESNEANATTLQRRMQRELEETKRQLTELTEENKVVSMKLARVAETEREYNELKKEYELTKASLRDQRGQVDAQRARLKNMEEMWQEEKKRSDQLRKEVEDSKVRIEKTEEHYNNVVKEHSAKMREILQEKIEEERMMHIEDMREQQQKEKQVREKLKKAKMMVQKAKQKFDEMVLENEKLQTQFEEFKISAFRYHNTQEHNDFQDGTDRIKNMIKQQQTLRKEKEDAFHGGRQRF